MRDWTKRLQEASKPPSDTISPEQAWKKARRGRFQQYFDDPEGFARDILGLSLWEGNREILTKVRDHDRVAIRAGRKVSKSNSLAALAYWWLLARGGRVMMTSTTYAQVSGVLWREIQAMNERANLGLNVPLDPGTGIRRGLASIEGRTAANRESMQGYSGPDVLYLIDEASGVDSDIIEAIEGNCAGGGKIVMAGNPTTTSGRYFDALYNPNTRWNVIHLNSELSPNVIAGKVIIPGLANRDWIEQMREEWGEDSPLYQVHVKGNAPLQAENAVIGIGLVSQARAAHDDVAAEGPLRIGVDVARFGDDVTVIQGIRGLWSDVPRSLSSMDGHEVGAAVVAYATQARRDDEKVRVKVDVIGVGASVVDYLTHLGPDWIEVLSISASNASYDKNYAKVRDQLWFLLRNWLKDGGSLPPHPHLEAELIAPVYGFDQSGRIKVEGKDEIKKRLGRSPDFADAFALAVYEGRIRKPNTKANKPIPGFTGIA